jgi:asparagine synthase (glutamine-hydrolysing)
VSREISKNEKVVVGGDGGDELFGGYDSYHFAHKYDQVKSFDYLLPIAKALTKIYPVYRTRFLESLLVQSKLPKHNLLNRNMGFNEKELTCLLYGDSFAQALNEEHRYIWQNFTPHSKNEVINVMSGSIKTRLLNDYLVKIDRSSMYASLEMRCPFLDKDLAEFAATLTPKQVFYKRGPKSILKEIASKYFDSNFTERNKVGFGIPIGEWFRGKLFESLKEVVLNKSQNLAPLNYPYIEKLINEHASGDVNHSHKLWSLYVFHVWAGHQ